MGDGVKNRKQTLDGLVVYLPAHAAGLNRDLPVPIALSIESR